MQQNPSQARERDPPAHDLADRRDERVKTFDLKTVLLCTLIFFTAVSVRMMHWQDMRTGSPHAGMEAGETARLLLQGKFGLFLRGPDPTKDVRALIRPPGYPILVAAILKMFGDSDAVMRTFQILCDGIAAVFVFVIAGKLLSATVAPTIAALLVALSPQIASYSFLLLPDSLVVVPILGAMYAVIKFIERPSFITAAVIGSLIGLSCWLRANTLLLAPFLAILIIILLRRRHVAASYYAAVLVGFTILVVAPITLRNLIVFKRFIPIQLGSGVTLIEGIADYDTGNRFGLPRNDLAVCRNEAALYNRPDYVNRLFLPGGASIWDPDGFAREEARLARGLAVIRSHPLWFGGVMIRRAANMLRLERSSAVTTEPSGTHSLVIADGVPPAWSRPPSELASTVALPSSSRTRLSTRGETLRIESDDFRTGEQVILRGIPVEKNTDYLLKIPVKAERDGMSLSVVSLSDSTVLASRNVYQWVDTPPDEQPFSIVQIPFVSRETSEVDMVFGDFSEKTTRPIVEIGRIQVFSLGTASLLWTRFPRLLAHTVQKFFLTAVVLPLVIAGFVLLVRAGQKQALVIMLAIPAYYMCFQSALHVEYRYILPVHYFTFMLAAVALTWIGKTLWHSARRLTRSLTTAR